MTIMMTSRRPSLSLLQLSDRVYRFLLVLYPAAYRQAYGGLMAQVFRDMCRDAYRQTGTWGIIEQWTSTLIDLAITVFHERRKAGIEMSGLSQFLRRIGGVLLIAGGVMISIASIAELQPGLNYPLRGIYQVFGFLFAPAIVLISLGTIGLVLTYQHKTGSVGRLALFGAFWGILVIVAYMVLALITQVDTLWNMFIGGFLLHAVSMVVFGLTALGARPLPRWNWLPIVIGVMPLIMFVFNPNRNGIDTEWENIIVYVVMGLGYAALGYVMHKDQTREMTAVTA
jgi:hypothetical protein